MQGLVEVDGGEPPPCRAREPAEEVKHAEEKHVPWVGRRAARTHRRAVAGKHPAPRSIKVLVCHSDQLVTLP